MTSGALISKQFLQTIVAIDDAAIEIVKVGRRIAAAIERDHRAKIRRQHRQDIHDHPFRPRTVADHRLEHLQPAEQLRSAPIGSRASSSSASIAYNLLLHVELRQNLLHGFCAATGFKDIAELARQREVFVLAQNLADVQIFQIIFRRIRGFEDLPFHGFVLIADGLQFSFQLAIEIFERRLAVLFFDLRDDVCGIVDDAFEFLG